MPGTNELWTNKNQLKAIFAKVKRLALRFVAQDVLDVDDVIQNVMIKLMETKKLGRNNFWLSQVVKNSATDSLRKSARQSRYDSYYGNELEEIVDRSRSWLTKSELEKFAEADDLHETLKRLSPEARLVLSLLADDYTYEEIARSTKVKLGTVRSRVFYARVQARKLLRSS